MQQSGTKQFLRSWLTLADGFIKNAQEQGRASAEISTWLVGFAVVALGIIVQNGAVFWTYSKGCTDFAVIGMLVCIIAGISQKLLYNRYEIAITTHMYSFITDLTAISTDTGDPAIPLKQEWDREEILLRLREDLDVRTHGLENIGLEDLRTFYSETYEHLEKFERRLESATLDLGEAYFNFDLSRERAVLAEGHGEPPNLSERRAAFQKLASINAWVKRIRVLAIGAFLAGLLSLLWVARLSFSEGVGCS